MLIRSCQKVECGLGPAGYKMFINLVLDFLVGLVPFLGDVADAAYKCNSRNVRLLEERLDHECFGYTRPFVLLAFVVLPRNVQSSFVVSRCFDHPPFAVSELAQAKRDIAEP